MCQCPREKGPTPLGLTHLFGVYGGEEQTMQSLPAGPVHWTPHVHKLCYQGIKNKTCLFGCLARAQNYDKKIFKKQENGHLFFGG